MAKFKRIDVLKAKL